MSTEHVDDESGRWSADVQRRLDPVAEDVRRRLGPGVRLGDDARVAFEGHLGGDLSEVMIHRGPLAGYLARSLGAEALSTGEHVLGGDEALDPSTASGAGLLGHELTHVLQRSPSEMGEQQAQVVERTVTEIHRVVAETGHRVDTDALAERVYQRMVEQMRRERERGAWIA